MLEILTGIFVPHLKILLAALLMFFIIERLRPWRGEQKKWRRDTHVDLAFSFTNPLLAYPASAFVSAWLMFHFWGTLPFTGTGGPERMVQTLIDQAPEHGRIISFGDGAFRYEPDSGYAGGDGFTLTRSDGFNSLSQKFRVQVQPAAVPGVAGNPAPVQVHYLEMERSVAGEVRTGVSGFFFDIRQAIGQWSFLLQVLLAVFLVDFIGYWRHRLMHTRYLWPFHAVHHSPRELDWLSNERFHPVNTHIANMLSLTAMILLFEDPSVLVPAMVIRKLYGMFAHSNARISFGPLNALLVSPVFHHWHHSDGDRANSNFAAIFAMLDRIFGTYSLPEDAREPESLGVSGEAVPETFWGQIVHPFVRLARMIPGESPVVDPEPVPDQRVPAATCTASSAHATSSSGSSTTSAGTSK